MSPLVAAVLVDVPEKDAGVASGVVQTITRVGMTFGVTAIGLVFFTVLDTGSGDPESYSQAFSGAVFTPLVLALFALALVPLFDQQVVQQQRSRVDRQRVMKAPTRKEPFMSQSSSFRPVEASGTFHIGGDLPVHQMGFGAMRIVGPEFWGPPVDRDNSLRLLRRAVELGVDLIDTAEAYGPDVSEELIREALHPYPEGLVIATKGGLLRPNARELAPIGSPEFLRKGVEKSLRNLGVETIDLYQLHRVDPSIPVEESIGALNEFRREGKIRHLGLSEVRVEEIERAGAVAEISTVQNRYNVADREYDDVVDYCTTGGIGFMPWFPLASGSLAETGGPLARLADDAGVTPSQLALAWLLQRSPAILPIPGTGELAHLEENCLAATIHFESGLVTELNELA